MQVKIWAVALAGSASLELGTGTVRECRSGAGHWHLQGVQVWSWALALTSTGRECKPATRQWHWDPHSHSHSLAPTATPTTMCVAGVAAHMSVYVVYECVVVCWHPAGMMVHHCAKLPGLCQQHATHCHAQFTTICPMPTREAGYTMKPMTVA